MSVISSPEEGRRTAGEKPRLAVAALVGFALRQTNEITARRSCVRVSGLAACRGDVGSVTNSALDTYPFKGPESRYLPFVPHPS